MLGTLHLCQGLCAGCHLIFYFDSPRYAMAPTRPDSSSSTTGPKPSAGRPRIFGGGTRRSARIEKRSAIENEHTKKLRQEKNEGSSEAVAEKKAQPQRARPGPELNETPSSRRLAGRALPSDRCLRNANATRNTKTRVSTRFRFVDDIQDESGEAVAHRSTGQTGYHTIAEGGPKLKNIAELIAETDIHQHFRIPSDKIIASEDVDNRVYQQMRRHAKDGNLTPDRVRTSLVKSVNEFETWWRIRRSRPRFWKRVCNSDTWMSQLDGADCRDFFLWLCAYFRNVQGKQDANEMVRSFERLVKLFKGEMRCELDDLVGVQQRLGQPASQSRGRSRDSVAPKKRGSKTVPEDGNIFAWSGDTNMSDFELSGIDVQGLTPVVDVGGRRRKDEAYRRAFDDHVARLNREKEDAKKRQKSAAAPEAAATPMARSTMQGSKRSCRMRPSPSEAPQTNQQKDAMAGRAFYEFDEGEEANAGDEEEGRMAAALKRQRLLERHAARGGPTSD